MIFIARDIKRRERDKIKIKLQRKSCKYFKFSLFCVLLARKGMSPRLENFTKMSKYSHKEWPNILYLYTNLRKTYLSILLRLNKCFSLHLFTSIHSICTICSALFHRIWGLKMKWKACQSIPHCAYREESWKSTYNGMYFRKVTTSVHVDSSQTPSSLITFTGRCTFRWIRRRKSLHFSSEWYSSIIRLQTSQILGLLFSLCFLEDKMTFRHSYKVMSLVK